MASRTALLSLLFLVAACGPPLHVRRVTPTDFYREQSESALSGPDVSDWTRTVLRRHDLLERYEDDPDGSIAALRESVVQGRGDGDELFALAELSLYRAQEHGSAPHYLAGALYAYAFLFPDDPAAVPGALDPRTRMACDLYNRALAKALQGGTGDYVSLQAGTFALPFGTMSVAFDPATLAWHDYRLVDLTPVGEMKVEGMRNRYRVPGIGAPLAARPLPSSGTYGAEDLVGPNIRVPVTAVLRIDHPRQQLVTPTLEGTLEVHATTSEESIRIGDRTIPLEAEPTAVLASTLVAARPWDAELAAFLGDALALKPQPMLLRAFQPYTRGRIPVVLVHGTASSPFRWMDMVNDLLQDPRIRAGYQFWFFAYDSGNPILYSGYGLRRMLAARVAAGERDGPDPALHQMVVIGHSQGGLLTKLTAIDSGDRFWSNVSDEPFDAATMSAQTRELLQDAMFIKPLPFVTRVIFVCTPHRGSYLAGPQLVRRLVQRLVRLPSDMVKLGGDLAHLSSGAGRLPIERVPTSIDNMSPGHPFIRVLSTIPIEPGVTAHSIIAVTQTKDVEHGNDGVVEYQSAHIDGVESELVVQSSHSAQANPHTVEEVRRILLEHLAQVRAKEAASARRPD